jgi:hypothetical protein
MSMKAVANYPVINPRCLMHIVGGHAPRAVRLADGTTVDKGEAIAQMHFWNEHLPRSTGGVTSAVLAVTRESLEELASRMQQMPNFREARAIYGEMGFLPESRLPQFQRILEGLGLELVPGDRPGLNPFCRAFWRNTVSWWYLRKFNVAASKQLRVQQIRRCEVWISREQLLARYGA